MANQVRSSRFGRLAAAAAVVVAAAALGAPAMARTADVATLRVASVKPVLRYPQIAKELDPAKLNVVRGSKSLTFNVAIHNSGTSRKTNVKVTLVIDPKHARIKAVDTIGSIGPNQTAYLLLSEVGKVPYAVRTTMTVTPSGGETKVYPVIFTLP